MPLVYVCVDRRLGMRSPITDSGSTKDPSSRKPLWRAYKDMVLLVASWFVVACYITFIDSMTSRAAEVSLYTGVFEDLWYDMLCTGLIGALYAERDKLLWCLISVIGGLITLGVMVIMVTFVGDLLSS